MANADTLHLRLWSLWGTWSSALVALPDAMYSMYLPDAWLAAAPKARQESCQHTEAITVPFPGSAPQRNGEALVEVRQTRQTATWRSRLKTFFVEAVALGTDHSYQAQELSWTRKKSKFEHFDAFCTCVTWTYFGRILEVFWMCLSMSIFVTFGLRLALVGGRVYRWGLQGAAGLALLVVSAGLGSARIEMWIFQKLAQRFFAMRYRDIISAFVVPLVASH